MIRLEVTCDRCRLVVMADDQGHPTIESQPPLDQPDPDGPDPKTMYLCETCAAMVEALCAGMLKILGEAEPIGESGPDPRWS